MSELIALAGMIISVAAAMVSVWFARKNNVRQLENDLDDLSSWAEKAVRASRTARMREVRAATKADQENAPPLELKQDALAIPASPTEVKKALRQRFFGKGITH